MVRRPRAEELSAGLGLIVSCELGIMDGGVSYRKMDSAWNRSLRQAKQSSAVNEYPAVSSATTKTDSTAKLNLSCGSLAYRPGRMRYLRRHS
jgi:hypothetical protein